MAWIESHQELGRHPKTLKLARLLETSVPAAVGHLQFLWWWALDFAEDGKLTKFAANEIASACLWDGDGPAFQQALLDAGFLDFQEELRIHDWEDYAGKLVARRRLDRERKRTIPPKDSRGTLAELPKTPSEGAKNPSLPYPTVPNSNSTVPGGGAKAPSPARRGREYKPITPEFIDEMVGEFAERLGGDKRVRQIIDDALNHKAMDKRKDKRLYLRGWLRRDAEGGRDGRRGEPVPGYSEAGQGEGDRGEARPEAPSPFAKYR